MMGELKPCPFCGSMAWVHNRTVFGGGLIGHRVECAGTCHAMTCWWHSDEDATENWNQRTEQTSSKELEAQVKAQPDCTWILEDDE